MSPDPLGVEPLLPGSSEPNIIPLLPMAAVQGLDAAPELAEGKLGPSDAPGLLLLIILGQFRAGTPAVCGIGEFIDPSVVVTL